MNSQNSIDSALSSYTATTADHKPEGDEQSIAETGEKNSTRIKAVFMFDMW